MFDQVNYNNFNILRSDLNYFDELNTSNINNIRFRLKFQKIPFSHSYKRNL